MHGATVHTSLSATHPGVKNPYDYSDPYKVISTEKTQLLKAHGRCCDLAFVSQPAKPMRIGSATHASRHDSGMSHSPSPGTPQDHTDCLIILTAPITASHPPTCYDWFYACFHI